MRKGSTFDVELIFPDRQAPGLDGKIRSIKQQFGEVSVEDTGGTSVVFKNVSERKRAQFSEAMALHFTHPRFVYSVVDPTKQPIL